MISEVLLLKSFESYTRTANQKDVVLGLLPQSHIFGLAVFHAAVFRGECVVVLHKFELETLLDAVHRCKINVLYLVSHSFLCIDVIDTVWPIVQGPFLAYEH